MLSTSNSLFSLGSSETCLDESTSSGWVDRLDVLPSTCLSLANRKAEQQDTNRKDKRGQGYRRLWQQVTRVGRGDKLNDDVSSSFADMTVEDLLRIVTNLTQNESAVAAVERGLHFLDSSALAALLKELSRHGRAKRAVEIFDWLRGLPDNHELSSLCDVYTYTTMISQCGSHQQLRRALELVAEMKSKGIPCNVHTFSALMNVCIKSKELELALDVYQQMLQEGCSPNLVTFNTLIDVYVKTAQWEEAMRVLDTMDAQGIQAEVRTYNTIITACNKNGHLQEGWRVYERMLSAGVKPSATTYTTLISAYGKKGQIDKVMEIFQEMVEKGCERNVITYSSLISACERAGRLELAMDLFARMMRENCKPNAVTYNALITACANGGQWEKAMEYFNQMSAEGCKPDSITFGALIAAYERGGQWRLSLRAFEQMQAQGCHPDALVFNSLLEVLWESGVLVAQMRAVALWAAANRCGHFRLYTQAKPDASTTNYSCGALQAGAAVVSVLRWLLELRTKLAKEGQTFETEKIVFTVQKMKHNRAEHSSLRVLDRLSSLLEGHKSPFVVNVVEQSVSLEASAEELAAWLKSSHSSLLFSVFQSGASKRMSVEYLLNEDFTVEMRCTEAFAAVLRYEAELPDVLQMSQQLMYQRTQMVHTAFRFGQAFGFKEGTVYDALTLLDKLLCLNALAANTTIWPLLLCGCLLVVGRQNEHAGTFPCVENIVRITGFSVENVMAIENNIYVWLNNKVSNISAFRVAHLLLERLGHYASESRQFAVISKDIKSVMQKVACGTVFLNTRPSVLACAVVYGIRRFRGLVPWWPTALQSMTRYQSSHFAGCAENIDVLLQTEILL